MESLRKIKNIDGEFIIELEGLALAKMHADDEELVFMVPSCRFFRSAMGPDWIDLVT